MNIDEQMNTWVAQVNHFGLWIVGPEIGDGTINVIGMGRTKEEAYEMAQRSGNGTK